MKDSWRFIQTGFNDPYTNMAVDEAILIAYSQGRIPPTLRIYGWRPSAFSLGYFQDPTEVLDIARCDKENISFVRRMTGGGMIFHHRELTYSLVCSPDKLNVCASTGDSFRIICSFLIETYKKLGLKPCFAQEKTAQSFKRNSIRPKNPLCFASRERYDILIQGKKIGGNAQRRKKDIIFQHGSIPLSSDIDTAISFLKETPRDLGNEICSLEEVLGKKIGFLQLENALRESFEETFSVNLREENLTFREESQFRELREEKYCNSQWNLYRIDNFRSVKKESNGSCYQKTCLA